MSELTLPCGNTVLLDDVDFERVARHPWRVVSYRKERPFIGYSAGKRVTRLTRFITRLSKGTAVHLRNNNIFDCRRSNLRFTHYTG